MTLRRLRSLAAATALAVCAGAGACAAPVNADASFARRCAALATHAWPDLTTRVDSAVVRDGMFGTPAHCEAYAGLHARVGRDGQRYRIRFHLRLPERWNGRFVFEGGGGSDGVVGDALGRVGPGPTALSRGYAVVSQDAGHDATANARDDRGGPLAFGFDAQARADYGRASLQHVADAARAAIVAVYGRAPDYAYFVGCSKGGQEGMVFAQDHPATFDGILASAPGFSLPRAAVAEAWDTASFARLIPGPATPSALAETITPAELSLVAAAVLAACDADDGLVDGVVGAFERCTAARVAPELARRTCAANRSDDCVRPGAVAALRRNFDGAHDASGRALYADWAWDAGIAAPGWRAWKLGDAGGAPALNVLLGLPSLAAVFSTPPRAFAGPEAALGWAARFDFDRDARRIYATTNDFPRSGWTDASARSPDLAAFRARGGRMIVPHGVSDPVFSIHDTLAWWREVDARMAGHAADVVRVFPVPGMNHCGGGPATDDFDAFASLVDWVERGHAPTRIEARAGSDTPWPGRTRPLCAYPAIARYRGGDVESAVSFVCAR